MNKSDSKNFSDNDNDMADSLVELEILRQPH
jgi:hypothetical protein